MPGDIIERKNIKEVTIDGERIFLKKSKIFGWGVVHPYKIDGKINWENLIAGGNWNRLFIIGVIVTILVGALFEYTNALKIAKMCLDNPPGGIPIKW